LDDQAFYDKQIRDMNKYPNLQNASQLNQNFTPITVFDSKNLKSVDGNNHNYNGNNNLSGYGNP